MFDPDTGLCRPCERAVAKSPAHRYLVVVVAISAVAAGVSWLEPHSGTWLKALGLISLNMLLAIGLKAVFTVFHELGHALMARFWEQRVLSIAVQNAHLFGVELHGTW